jgi:hypothetical protein
MPIDSFPYFLIGISKIHSPALGRAINISFSLGIIYLYPFPAYKTRPWGAAPHHQIFGIFFNLFSGKTINFV